MKTFPQVSGNLYDPQNTVTFYLNDYNIVPQLIKMETVN
jgi:hypothetical protein